MLPSHCDEINSGDNVIIGLGDSFTQGLGAYSLDTWRSISTDPAMYNITGQNFRDEQAKNNWVRQLRDNFLPDYKVFNLGINGAGNRAAVKELYLNPLPKNLGNVIVILMATAKSRYDFLKKSDETAGENWHQKWQTIFPARTNRGIISRLDTDYFELIYTERNDSLEYLFNVSEAQSFCRVRGYNFLFSISFDSDLNYDRLITTLDTKSKHIDMVDWNDFIKITDRRTFIDMLGQLETNKYRSTDEIFNYNRKLKLPTKYITPCAHWTVEGNYKVAEYLANELENRKLI